MTTEIVAKKKNTQMPVEGKSKGVNALLWVLAALFFVAAAIGNLYLEKEYSTPVRVIGMAVAMVIACVLAALTNQGTKALGFLKDARAEARRVTWPTRQETNQTTLIVIGVTVLASLIFWAMDSIIVVVINFLTELRF